MATYITVVDVDAILGPDWAAPELKDEAVFEAIVARDSARAQKAMKSHLEAVGERLTAALLERRPS